MTKATTTTTTAGTAVAAAADFQWPAAAAGRATMAVPDGWNVPDDGVDSEEEEEEEDRPQRTRYCAFEYDRERGLVRVVLHRQPTTTGVDDDDGDGDRRRIVLDAFDPDDLIGVQLELRLDEEEEGNEDAHGDCDAGNTDAGRAANEPSTDLLADRRGAAVLHLYSYPRATRDGKLGWVDWCLGRTSSAGAAAVVPDPNYERCGRVGRESNDGSDNIDDDNRSPLLSPGPPSPPAPRTMAHRQFQFKPSEDLSDVSKVVEALRQLAQLEPTSTTCTTTKRRRRLLVLVNPACGANRNALQTWRETVRPMLVDQAGIRCDCLVTGHANHACERLRRLLRRDDASVDDDDEDYEDLTEYDFELDLAEYDGLVVLGGDGTMHQVLNAVVARPDGAELLLRMPVGLIPCGSANGFAASVANESGEAYGIVEACYLIWYVREVFAVIVGNYIL